MANFFGNNEARPEPSWQFFLGIMKRGRSPHGKFFWNTETGPEPQWQIFFGNNEAGREPSWQIVLE